MTSTKDHPNNAPGVPMKFPVWFEKFQIKYFNPAIRPIAKYLPGMSVIKHRGRTSGTPYETVVSAYRKGDTVAVLLAHGKTNWVKNILAAGEADIRLGRHDLHLVNPRVVAAGTDDPSLPGIARGGVKRGVGAFVADIA
ncbi:nitroreductase family deazaflavin-dependent oxidoreductase [Mycolicibacterium sp. CH28]|uniref:nitroreductase family deazaflavin-dependent oxidoreductase n=1 Tax=Mycolicibacterium sp. CH28 TaxID=2512237 RepID=UPI001080BE89|nr:nitroreductase family deazaflavin-dependent oxidoreductase [Mycolicibacterium sp. CH28]TGD90509.1 nitroreductase family deazaflavin-dependent oxidoreductase [Mycolicibacterium sp. CH28]